MKIGLQSTIPIALILVCLSCGSDSPTDPNNALDGIWQYNTGDFQTPTGDTCSISAVRFEIEQDGSHFSGTVTQEGTLSCDGPGGPRSELTDLRVVSSGEFDGETVSFQFFGDDITNDGVLNGGSMQGTVTIAEDFFATTTFTAEKLES